jgi:hypothetical protein
MRVIGVIGLGVLFSAGCGSSNVSDGGTGTATTGSATTGATSGSTTGGTTGHATTGGTATGTSTSGGTTTGGGGLANGAACASNASCQSGVCGINGSGNCCTMACSTSDATCGATACDHNGACTYPPSTTTCGTVSCAASMLTTSDCNGMGTCTANASTACPNHFACADATSCKTTCTSSADCAIGSVCNGGACTTQIATGACTENDACTSGVCGIAGTGHCCTAACAKITAPCGATDCDTMTGACVFPNNMTSCGSESCTGHTQTNATTCDGMGSCQTATTSDCTPFICGTTACATTCTDNTGCTTGGFCDTASSKCCSGLAIGGTVAVDAVTGSDSTACCGIGANGKCRTLNHVMTLIDAAQTKNVTISATVDGGGGDWSSAEGAHPIVLGWGVELSAPGVYFLDPNDPASNGPEIFDVTAYSANDTVGYASIVGTATNPIHIGFNSAGTQTKDANTIGVENGSTLYVANASVNGNATTLNITTFFVNGGGTLTLGADQSGANPGTVQIGNSLGATATDGWTGITCGFNKKLSLGCTVNDLSPGPGLSGVVIQGQENIDIDAEEFAKISLTANPVIGVAPSKAGFGNCPQKTDFLGVLAQGQVTLTFQNGVMQCIAGDGFELVASQNGNANPSVTIDNTIIQNTDLGIYASAGTATVTNTTINYNFVGVQQDRDFNNHNGTIDLSGGGNTVVCSQKQESSTGSSNEGIDVYNSSASTLNASNVAWDTTSPDYFSCTNTSTTATCSCKASSCSATAPFDDMDAVTIDAGITTTGNTQAATTCL